MGVRMQLVTAQFLLAKWQLLASPLEASPAPLQASFRALVRQSEAMASFVMERDALCASDRVSLWKITSFASVNLRYSKVIKRVRIVICVFPNSLKSHALRCSRGESLFF